MPILRKIYTILIDFVETLVIAGAIFVVIYAFILRPFQVNGQSMFPNYHNGEYILTNLLALKIGTPKRGEVIVFQAPADKEKDFIKRVIGLPGDKVSINGGTVFVNGLKLDESEYLPSDYKTYGGNFLNESKEVVVPPDNFFVLGDNRNFSSDSREWGFVPKNKIIGKSFFVYWPLNRMGLVKQGKYNIDY